MDDLSISHLMSLGEADETGILKSRSKVPCQSFEVGEIIWARLPNFSFWPAIVTKSINKSGKLHVNFLSYDNDVSIIFFLFVRERSL